MSVVSITFFGVRGSIPVCGSEVAQFGGNTTCIAFLRKKTNRISIMDAGTGIRNLGKHINEHYPEQRDLNITFSHFHWDHIQGFPFFDPAYNPQMTIDIQVFGKDMPEGDLRNIFSRQMMEDYFPVPLQDMGAHFNFNSSPQRVSYGEGVSIETIEQNHPGGSFGFRVEVDGICFVICTDHEHGDMIEDRFVEFCRDADLLIHDAQYTSEELKTHKGWGHSSYDQCIELAKRAGVKQLVLTHHDPDHNDAFLNKMETYCQERFPNCQLAREGMTIEL